MMWLALARGDRAVSGPFQTRFPLTKCQKKVFIHQMRVEICNVRLEPLVIIPRVILPFYTLLLSHPPNNLKAPGLVVDMN